MNIVRLGMLLCLVACSSGSVQTRTTQDRSSSGSAAPVVTSAGSRGAACSETIACGSGLMCMPSPGGYCASYCGVTGDACLDGAVCAESVRAGEVCLKACQRDADCRTGEGYRCDPVWQGCIVPNNSMALKPPTCTAKPPPIGTTRQDAWSTSAAPGLYQFEPTSVLLDDGGVVTMYVAGDRMGAPNSLGLARIDGAGKQTIDVPFKTDRTSHFNPWLARDRKGTIHAVWLGFNGRGRDQVIGYATSSDAGATWSKPRAIHDPADCKGHDCLDKPMIAIGPDATRKGKDAIFVFYATDDGLHVVASHDGGATFSTAVKVLDGVYGNVVVDKRGVVHVVTLNGGPRGAWGSTEQAVEYTRSVDGGVTWSAPVTVSAGESLPFFFSNPSIVRDDKRGVLYAAYTSGIPTGSWDIHVVASSDEGKSWRGSVIADPGACTLQMLPNLALDPTTGRVHVTWYDNEIPDGRLAHTSCAIKATSCAPPETLNSVPFAALSTVRHGSKWLGQYETLPVDDKRRTLHAVWTQPIGTKGAIVSRVFHAAVTLPRR